MTTNLVETIRNSLDEDGRITSRDIHVSAKQGTITLHGVVDSLEEFGIAQEIAEATPGVEQVTNHLSIDGEVNTGPCCPQM